MDANLLKVAVNNFGSIFAADIYQKTGIDFTYPSQIYAQVNTACNSKCPMCNVWREKDVELPAGIWIEWLKNVRSFIGPYKICFAGGEVFLKKDIFDIFEYCSKEKVPFGITTNGILLTKENIHRFLDLNPLNINISMDSMDEELYNQLRGVPALNLIKSNIEYLMEYIEKNKSHVKVSFKTVISSKNLNQLAGIAEYARKMNIMGITYDPIKKRRKIFEESNIPEFEEIYAIDKNKLKEVIEELVHMKRNGYNILNSEENMQQWLNYDKKGLSRKCDVPLRNLVVNSDGNIHLCDFNDISVSNIKDSDFASAWKKSDVKRIKAELTNCKNNCQYCMKRGFKDYLKLFLKYS